MYHTSDPNLGKILPASGTPGAMLIASPLRGLRPGASRRPRVHARTEQWRAVTCSPPKS